MSSNTDLEIKGNLRDNRLAELLIEIFQAKLNGSLRAANAAHKTVVYFDAGELVFAVSNARAFRLFELILGENKISKEQLASIPEFTNDLILRNGLLEKKFFSKPEIDGFFALQIGQILKDAFFWQNGEWIFSPLVRIKGDIRFKIDTTALLLEQARNSSTDDWTRNFKNPAESFVANKTMPAGVDLHPEEAFVFSRFEDSSMTIEKIQSVSGLSDAATLRILYILWLGGFLTRQNWNSPFSSRQVSHILSANLSLKKDENLPLPKAAEAKTARISPVVGTTKATALDGKTPVETEKEPEVEITLEEYLERTADSANYYRFFAVAPDASVAEIKRSYFMLARRFHPDLFHKDIDVKKHQQVQDAFTKIAQAYETLKNESTRSVYDYKMQKELAEMEKRQAEGISEPTDVQKHLEEAKAAFDHGFTLLLDDNYRDAVPFLARAAHFYTDNARYRAYYGKALAADDKQKHKAEAELQAAVKLDPNNADIRLMLAEFFIQMQLPKRAEGELNRLLAIFPSNGEARALLDTLPKR